MNQKKRRSYIQRISVIVAAVLLLCAMEGVVSAEDVPGGSCGENLTWSFSGGTLTISGSGPMDDYRESSSAPWSGLRGEILRLVLPDGLTNIGQMAFYGCSRLTAADIPDGVTSIGDYAFTGCKRLALLDLGEGLQTIGDGAFYDCWSLVTLRLPQSLRRIGEEAFYDCRSLTGITVPAKVDYIGPAAFAYCTAMVRAELKNSVTSLPDWAFFGCAQLTCVVIPETVQTMGNAAFRNCDNLYYVSYGGDEISREAMEDAIAKDVPNFDVTGNVTQDIPSDTTVSSTMKENADGSVTIQSTAVTQTENASVVSNSQQIIGGTQVPTTQITVTVENDAGWSEVVDVVDEAVSESLLGAPQDGATDTQVTVYVKDAQSVDQQFWDKLAGRDVKVSVVTKDGFSWTIDCSSVDIRQPAQSYDLRYSLQDAAQDKCKQMSVDQGYLLKFNAKATVNAELVIRLPQELARRTATLFHQENRRTLVLHQSVLIDDEGCAHFYLGEVTNEVDYYIGINVPGTMEDAIVPESLHSEFGIDFVEPIQYVITGRESSWGIGIGTVTWILVAVMIGTVAGVGVVMYNLNKRKLKKGYIPDTSDGE